MSKELSVQLDQLAQKELLLVAQREEVQRQALELQRQAMAFQAEQFERQLAQQQYTIQLLQEQTKGANLDADDIRQAMESLANQPRGKVKLELRQTATVTKSKTWAAGDVIMLVLVTGFLVFCFSF